VYVQEICSFDALEGPRKYAAVEEVGTPAQFAAECLWQAAATVMHADDAKSHQHQSC
jgi:hypothetical protein